MTIANSWVHCTYSFILAGDAKTYSQSRQMLSDGVCQGVARLREAIPNVRIVLGTLTTALNATTGGHGSTEVDTHRRAFNDFIRTCNLFDGVIDFDAVTIDKTTGEMRPEMCPGSSIGGPGDRLHPNRIGYQAMGGAVDLDMIVGE